MRRLLWGVSLLLALVLFLGLATGLSQAATFCSPGQQPHFSHGFAFLKSQLGEIMGQPVACERYDAAGNASQQTTTGQAFYDKETNTPMFTAGKSHWAWTSAGLKQWTDAGVAPLESASPPELQAPLATTSVRAMSYNILYGAGADPGWERAAAQLSPFAYPGNRLPKILRIIKIANPDILGVQEAGGWDKGSPSIVQQVAEELGMNYFLAPAGNGLHLVLFTKFKLVETANLSSQIGNVGALRATLSTPDGQLMHVFVVHLDPFSAKTRASELVTLTQEMAPYLPAPTLLMGDMNFYCLDDPEHCQEYQVLSQAGWRLAQNGAYKLDQIWISPVLDQPVSAIDFPGASFDISDHLPVGAIIEIPLA
jgi:endonuclease/exonuclease/phosphatase family metal-dependent hydrolase